MHKPSIVLLSGVVAALFSFSPRPAIAAGSPIDRIDLSTIFGYANTYGSANGLLVIGVPEDYHLDDGTSWESGAGGAGEDFAKKSAVAVSGDDIDFTLDMPVGSLVYLRIDYDSGKNSSNGQLVSSAPLVLHATIGSPVATLSGYAVLTVDQYANYSDDRFHFFNAPIGSLVPFDLTYTLVGGTWTPTTMDGSFDYTMEGTLDFTAAIVPEPSSACLLICALPLLAWKLRRRRPVAVVSVK